MSLIEQAADYRQYDVSDMNWGTVGAGDSPQRQFMSRAIALQSGEIQGKAVLDVGCGTGWFLGECLSKGAATATGLEPSRYAEAAEKVVGAKILKQTFQEFQTDERFDFISFIMSMEHLPNAVEVLGKANRLLNNFGKVLIMAADFQAFSMQRFNYQLEIEDTVEGKEKVVRTIRPGDYGTTIDIIRTPDYWLETAREAGFQLEQHQEVKTDEEYTKQTPKYELFRDKPLFQLFRFIKRS